MTRRNWALEGQFFFNLFPFGLGLAGGMAGATFLFGLVLGYPAAPSGNTAGCVSLCALGGLVLVYILELQGRQSHFGTDFGRVAELDRFDRHEKRYNLVSVLRRQLAAVTGGGLLVGCLGMFFYPFEPAPGPRGWEVAVFVVCALVGGLLGAFAAYKVTGLDRLLKK